VLGHTIEIKRDQIIVWVSLAPQGFSPLPQARLFPAVVDTGCNHSFVMRQQHLLEWSGAPLDSLRILGSAKIYGQSVPLLAANIWLHANRPGSRDERTNERPHLLEFDQGLAVVPQTSGKTNPRLPLLGMRALRWNHLHVAIDGHRRRVTIRTRRRFWLFG